MTAQGAELARRLLQIVWSGFISIKVGRNCLMKDICLFIELMVLKIVLEGKFLLKCCDVLINCVKIE